MAAKRETSVETTRSGLPGYENLTQEAYKTLMYKKLEERRLKLVAEYKAKGHRFPTKHDLRKAVSGASPRNTKKSSRNSKRPLVLTSCPERRRRFLDWHYGIYDLYKKAVMEYLGGYGRTTYTLNKVNNLALVAYRPSRRSRIWRRQILDLREIQLTDAIRSNQVGGNEKYQRRFVGIR